ncbi:unnamed protein product [Urochloa humidicola]
MKNPAMTPATQAAAWANDTHHRLVQAIGSSSRSQPVQWRQDVAPRVPLVIDLNEACEPVISVINLISPLATSNKMAFYDDINQHG